MDDGVTDRVPLVSLSAIIRAMAVWSATVGCVVVSGVIVVPIPKPVEGTAAL